ncbi:MAG: DUF5989 family protein [Desulfobulbaceae bacterium]|nr:DUF5989 family protein [Desulfobulbaceae bacterium]
MRKLKYLGRLLGEMCGYSWKHKVWWLVPLVLILIVFAFLISVGQISAPFLYTLF